MFNNGGRYAYVFDSSLRGLFAKRWRGSAVNSERGCFL